MQFIKANEQYVQLPTTEKDSNETSAEPSRLKRWAKSPACFVAIVATTFFAGAVFGTKLGSMSEASSNLADMSQGAKSFVPDIALESRKFTMKTPLMKAPSAESDKAWEDLIPVGYGYVNISDPETYNLPPGVESDSGPDTYSVTMFHQLHCLTHVRDRYWLWLNTALDPKSIPKVRPEIEKELRWHHTGHCLEYLAQSITCSADLTIEWARIDETGHRTDVDGGNVPHVCKNRDDIFEWMMANHAAPRKSSHHHVHLSNLVSD